MTTQEIAKTSEFINEAIKLNAEVKKLHKQIDKVGYKTEEGKKLLDKNSQLFQDFEKKYGMDLLKKAKSINQKKV